MRNKNELVINQKRGIRKEVFRTLVKLSIPTIIEEILATLMQYVDTAMVGNLGEQATAAVSVTTTVTWLVNSIPSAIGVGVLAMIAKAVGENDRDIIKRISQQVITLVMLCSVVLTAITVSLSGFIPVWMGAEEAVQGTASLYFLIVSIPMLFRVSSMLFGAAIRATQNTRTPMLISLFANVLNAVLNVILIYCFNMGVTGAAIASAVSYTVSGVFMYIAYRRSDLLYWKWRSFKLDGKVLGKCMKISLPVLGTSITSCFGYVVFAGLVSSMGTTVFAAHSIAVTAETIFYIPGYGLRTATSTLVGVSLGEQNKQKFDYVCSLSVIMTMVMMVISGVVLYIVSYPLMCLFTNSGDVAALGAEMLKIVAFSEPFFGLMIVLEGIFYGLSRTKYAFVIETASMWGVRILLTFLCVKVWGLDLYAVWYCMIIDNIMKALLFTLPVITRKQRQKLFLVKDKAVQTIE